MAQILDEMVARGLRPDLLSGRNKTYLTENVFEVVLQIQFQHKSANFPFIITYIQNKLTDLCWN